jgi:hypothetical protein
MAQMQTATISFHQVSDSYPTQSEINAGIYALNKMSGDLVKIPRDSKTYHVTSSKYSFYAPASAFPNAVTSKYDEKYNDLVKAKEILKNDRYGYDADRTIGAAIGLIKRFLESTSKV